MGPGSLLKEAWEMVPILLLLLVGGLIVLQSGVQRPASGHDLRQVVANLTQMLLRVMGYVGVLLACSTLSACGPHWDGEPKERMKDDMLKDEKNKGLRSHPAYSPTHPSSFRLLSYASHTPRAFGSQRILCCWSWSRTGRRDSRIQPASSVGSPGRRRR